MKHLAVLTLLLVTLTQPAAAQNFKTALYHCTTQDAVRVDEKGKFVHDKGTKMMSELVFPKFPLDVASGLLRTGNVSEPVQMKILHYGNSANDMVPIGTGVGFSAIAVVFRIRVWKPDMPFLFPKGSTVYSGKCRRM